MQWTLPVMVWSALAVGQAMAQPPLEIARDGQAITISRAGRPVLKYLFGGVEFKPYAVELYTPSGVQVLRDSPADHKHHHGLMFALNADGVEFWGREDEKCGRQVNRVIEDVKTSAEDGRSTSQFTQRLDWVAPGGQTLVREDRTVQVYTAADLDATLLTWRSRIEPAAGRETVQIEGRNYLGLGIRFVQSMDKGGKMLAAEENDVQSGKGAHILPRTRWVAYTALVDAKPVTVAMLDHPSNPRHPARMFTMTKPFAYLSATLGLDQGPLRLPAGRPLELRYGVVALDGDADKARIEALYRRWMDWP